MKTERPSFLWIITILAVPLFYMIVLAPLAFGTFVGLDHVAPGLRRAEMWTSQFAKTVIALFALWLICRYKLHRLAGLSMQGRWDHPLLCLVPVYIPIIMLYGTVFHVPEDLAPVLAALAFCFLIGFSEEVFFRGFIQSALIKLLWKKRGGIAFAVMISSTIFGMMHLVNCITINWGPGFNIGFEATAQGAVSALVQALYATFFGIFFGALLLKTNKLSPLVLMHALVNFPAAFGMMRPTTEAEEPGKVADQAGAESIVIELGSILWSAPLLLIGLIVMRTIKPADIAWKLDGAPDGAPSQTPRPTESQQRD